MALLACQMIGNVHLTTLVHPQFANNDVMYCRCHFTPSVVIAYVNAIYQLLSFYNHISRSLLDII